MKKKMLLCIILAVLGLTAACGRTRQEAADTEEDLQNEAGDTDASEASDSGASDTEAVSEDSETQENSAADTIFAEVADREFFFASGAGGWFTVLYIHEDGSFEGNYHDSDMGDMAEEYPNGTLYYCDFSGSFTEPEQVDELTYRFRIAEIRYAFESGEEIEDGVRYVYTTAYGLEGAGDLYLYLPGSELASLPEQYCRWVGYYNLETAEETELPFYGLYNEAEEAGFSSYVIEDDGEAESEVVYADWREQIRAEIAAAEEQAAIHEEELENAASQGDMNVASGELFTVWDDVLNSIWGLLKENLEETRMQALTEEQRGWIREKEAAAEEAGKEVEGGTLWPLIVNSEAARLTRERVYELAAEAGVDL